MKILLVYRIAAAWTLMALAVVGIGVLTYWISTLPPKVRHLEHKVAQIDLGETQIGKLAIVRLNAVLAANNVAIKSVRVVRVVRTGDMAKAYLSVDVVLPDGEEQKNDIVIIPFTRSLWTPGDPTLADKPVPKA